MLMPQVGGWREHRAHQRLVMVSEYWYREAPVSLTSPTWRTPNSPHSALTLCVCPPQPCLLPYTTQRDKEKTQDSPSQPSTLVWRVWFPSSFGRSRLIFPLFVYFHRSAEFLIPSDILSIWLMGIGQTYSPAHLSDSPPTLLHTLCVLVFWGTGLCFLSSEGG